MSRRLSLLFVFFSIVATGSVAEAQQGAAIVDHWPTEAQCRAAEHAPFYVPSFTSTKALGKDEVILPHPTGGCFEIELPDRLTKGFPEEGWGWIRIERGREVVFHSKTGKALKIAKCDNRIRKESPFSIPGISPNPFEIIEETGVVADPSLERQLGEAAKSVRPERDTRRGEGNAFTRFVKENKTPIIIATVAAATAAILLGRNVKAEASPQVGNYSFAR